MADRNITPLEAIGVVAGAGLEAIGVIAGAGLLYSWLNSSDRKTEVVDDYQKTVRAVKIIRKHCRENPVLGFDCEWVQESKVALLQLCTHKGYCALIRLCSLQTIASSLYDLLADRDVVKVGVGVKKDAQLLQNNGLQTVSTLDLRFVAVLTGLAKPQKLSSMYEEVLGKSLNKKNYLAWSNWEAHTLKSDEIEYAANDAIAGIEVYMKLAKSVPNVKKFEKYFDMHFDPHHHNGLKPEATNECNLQ
ncbi:exonuclease 3'-5' domain-containing protein 2-like isoform X1 [Eurosta solidaginis]|uniref:exonuclease 3'-5' domain-containing protein 2-like isoform X1 n=1 Tax=Eurosta solidaginis TaxID=178769 RepID=UPI003530B19A